MSVTDEFEERMSQTGAREDCAARPRRGAVGEHDAGCSTVIDDDPPDLAVQMKVNAGAARRGCQRCGHRADTAARDLTGTEQRRNRAQEADSATGLLDVRAQL